MPIYVYRCPRCGTETDHRRPVGRRDDPARCPVCDVEAPRVQVPGGTGFVLRGGGWAADGYAGGGGPPSEG